MKNNFKWVKVRVHINIHHHIRCSSHELCVTVPGYFGGFIWTKLQSNKDTEAA